jgi:hypothetical protein
MPGNEEITKYIAHEMQETHREGRDKPGERAETFANVKQIIDTTADESAKDFFASITRKADSVDSISAEEKKERRDGRFLGRIAGKVAEVGIPVGVGVGTSLLETSGMALGPLVSAAVGAGTGLVQSSIESRGMKRTGEGVKEFYQRVKPIKEGKFNPMSPLRFFSTGAKATALGIAFGAEQRKRNIQTTLLDLMDNGKSGEIDRVRLYERMVDEDAISIPELEKFVKNLLVQSTLTGFSEEAKGYIKRPGTNESKKAAMSLYTETMLLAATALHQRYHAEHPGAAVSDPESARNRMEALWKGSRKEVASKVSRAKIAYIGAGTLDRALKSFMYVGAFSRLAELGDKLPLLQKITEVIPEDIIEKATHLKDGALEFGGKVFGEGSFLETPQMLNEKGLEQLSNIKNSTVEGIRSVGEGLDTLLEGSKVNDLTEVGLTQWRALETQGFTEGVMGLLAGSELFSALLPRRVKYGEKASRMGATQMEKSTMRAVAAEKNADEENKARIEAERVAAEASAVSTTALTEAQTRIRELEAQLAEAEDRARVAVAPPPVIQPQIPGALDRAIADRIRQIEDDNAALSNRNRQLQRTVDQDAEAQRDLNRRIRQMENTHTNQLNQLQEQLRKMQEQSSQQLKTITDQLTAANEKAKEMQEKLEQDRASLQAQIETSQKSLIEAQKKQELLAKQMEEMRDESNQQIQTANERASKAEIELEELRSQLADINSRTSNPTDNKVDSDAKAPPATSVNTVNLSPIQDDEGFYAPV